MIMFNILNVEYRFTIVDFVMGFGLYKCFSIRTFPFAFLSLFLRFFLILACNEDFI